MFVNEDEAEVGIILNPWYRVPYRCVKSEIARPVRRACWDVSFRSRRNPSQRVMFAALKLALHQHSDSFVAALCNVHSVLHCRYILVYTLILDTTACSSSLDRNQNNFHPFQHAPKLWWRSNGATVHTMLCCVCRHKRKAISSIFLHQD